LLDLKKQMKKQKHIPNSIVRINLGNNEYVFGRLLKLPFIEFFDYKTSNNEPVDLERILSSPVLFKIAVSQTALTKNSWEIVGTTEKPLSEIPYQFHQDIINPKKCTIIDPQGGERLATPEECEGLERLAVWEATHVEDRIRDHYKGVPNKWYESNKVKKIIAR
jgi:hypothetical protein